MAQALQEIKNYDEILVIRKKIPNDLGIDQIVPFEEEEDDAPPLDLGLSKDKTSTLPTISQLIVWNLNELEENIFLTCKKRVV